MALKLIFAMTYTTLDNYLQFGKQTIAMVLQNSPMASVQLPSSIQNDEYKEMVKMKHPYLTDVWCTMDRLNLMLEQSGDALIQEQYCNVWKHNHYVSSVVCFCPDGTIPIAIINIPCCDHDSQVAECGGIHDKLESMYLRDGAKCTVESAFGNVECRIWIKLSQELIHFESDAEQRIACDVTSMQQSAEWGMHAFQSLMPCLKHWMKFEEHREMKVILMMMTLLYNL
jgi:hypothetical protein